MRRPHDMEAKIAKEVVNNSPLLHFQYGEPKNKISGRLAGEAAHKKCHPRLGTKMPWRGLSTTMSCASSNMTDVTLKDTTLNGSSVKDTYMCRKIVVRECLCASQ